MWLAPAQQSSADAAGPRLDRGERSLLRQLNKVRRAHGLPRLRANRRLQRAADSHCRDMLRADFFAHTSSNGTPMQARVSRYRPSDRIGETLAYLPRRQVSTRRVIEMWMGSPTHRAAILSRSFRRVGIARRVGGLGNRRVAVYTADFASRR